MPPHRATAAGTGLAMARRLPSWVLPSSVLSASVPPLLVILLAASGCSADPDNATGPAADQPVATVSSTGIGDDGGGTGEGTETTADSEIGDGDGPSTAAEPEVASGQPVADRIGAIAAATGASMVLGHRTEEAVLVWHDGRLTELAVPDNSGLWSDGRFIYRWEGDAADTARSADPEAVVLTLDGTEVCRVDGAIHHATERPDGSHVVAVEYHDRAEWDGIGEQSVPMEAVDCRTGDRQPIEPVTIHVGEAETRFIERIGGRVFEGVGDAEGNADIWNEQGVSINGRDYAGYHTFSPDGSVVVYGDMGAGAGPHLSPVVVARDTVTGEERWRAEFEIPFRHLWFVDDKVVVGFIDDETDRFEFAPRTDRLVLIEADSGRPAGEVDVGFDLLFVG